MNQSYFLVLLPLYVKHNFKRKRQARDRELANRGQQARDRELETEPAAWLRREETTGQLICKELKINELEQKPRPWRRDEVAGKNGFSHLYKCEKTDDGDRADRVAKELFGSRSSSD